MSALHLRHFAGDPNRPALGLHCMMGSGASWRPIAGALGVSLDLVAPDFFGHGRSPDWQPGEVDYHTAVTRAVAAEITRPLDLIGHSFGATVALRIAVAYPEAVRSLTLIEPVLFAAAPDAAQDALFSRMGEAFAEDDPARALADFLQVWGLQRDGDDPAPPSEIQLRQIELVRDTNDVLIHDKARILREGGLEAIDAPVMLIMGENSPPVIGKITDALAARLPDVGRATVPGAGHMAPLTHAAEVAGLITANLERA
ncbi:alpha/beta fold hydrolase [Paracoccus aminophilus]|uniref:Alpha/beta fold family hydrolase n=1 Tax=Paracoccus aminophilus JCM 7686 TaxID=1367847 RepID=S5XVE9_PARAH|nr:alpha/beta fold hydrolase [Paracoccus aminophilus]AGT09227.1 alpha/beta fold family hydrolase [Paracoccus aminophilus JCM 7686]